MKILFVFDCFVDIERVILSSINTNDIVYLFPLTSRRSITVTIEERIKSLGCNVETIQVARAVNSAADKLRDKYIQFIAEIPERVQHKGRNLKEFFAIDEYTSLWWFSLISEKNTFKSDAFNRLAQLDSIVEVIKRDKVERIIFGCESRKLENTLLEYSHTNHIELEILPTKCRHNLKMRVRISQKLLYLKHSLLLINSVIHTLFRTQAIKKKIGSLKRIIPQNDNPPLLFFSPYANIDESLARKAIFKNKLYIHLQEALENSKQNIIWIAMYVYSNNISFKKSLEYAEQFIKNGYIIFFLEEFISLGAQIKALFVILRSGFKFLVLEKNIYAAHDFGDYNIYSLFKDDWYSSFVGETGYQGVIYYYMFRNLLKRLKVKKCLYLCEMHAWEKALISARDALGIKTYLFGYQPGTISRMYLNYFNHPLELSGKGRYPISRPDKIICNGNIPYVYMKESGWAEEKLSIVEAIRYSYLKKYLNLKSVGKKQNIILLAFSISLEESSSILNIVYEAFKDSKDIEIWLRPHPFLRLESVFELSGIHEANFNFKLKDGELDDILSKVRVVVVGESSVSIEAIAHGCDVIIVDVPEWINMSPLKGVCAEAVRSIDSPESLRETIFSIFQKGYNPEKRAVESRKIISDFFYLNQHTDIPENFLKLLMSKNG